MQRTALKGGKKQVDRLGTPGQEEQLGDMGIWQPLNQQRNRTQGWCFLTTSLATEDSWGRFLDQTDDPRTIPGGPSSTGRWDRSIQKFTDKKWPRDILFSAWPEGPSTTERHQKAGWHWPRGSYPKQTTGSLVVSMGLRCPRPTPWSPRGIGGLASRSPFRPIKQYMQRWAEAPGAPGEPSRPR